jgi:hypothetical protein
MRVGGWRRAGILGTGVIGAPLIALLVAPWSASAELTVDSKVEIQRAPVKADRDSARVSGTFEFAETGGVERPVITGGRVLLPKGCVSTAGGLPRAPQRRSRSGDPRAARLLRSWAVARARTGSTTWRRALGPPS